MIKIVFYLFLFVVSSCSFLDSSSPEVILQENKTISLEDFQQMVDLDFDFTKESRNGKTFLQLLLAFPQPSIEKMMHILLEKEIIKWNTIFKDGMTLLNYVSLNPGDVSLSLAQELLDSPNKRAFFLESPISPLFTALNNEGKIRDAFLFFLLEQGFSVHKAKGSSGETPFMRFLSTFQGTDRGLITLFFKNFNEEKVDKEGRNLFHYLFLNSSSNLEVFWRILSTKKRYLGIFTVDKNNIYPLYLLGKNPQRFSFSIYRQLKEENPLFWKNQSFIDILFLNILANKGESFAPLFWDIVKMNPSMAIQNKEGENPLLIAVQNTNSYIIPVLELLVKRGADLYKTSNQGYNVLSYSTLNKGAYVKEIVSFFERQGLSIFNKDQFGRSLVSYAVLNEGPSSVEILKYFLGKGVESLSPDKEGVSPLAKVFSNPSSFSIPLLQTLVYSSYQGKYGEEFSQDVFLVACGSKSIYGYKLLLNFIQQGFNLKAQNLKGQNGFFIAVQNTGPAAVKMAHLLLMKGFSVGSIDKTGNTPLHYALYNKENHFAMVDLLLRWGADPFLKNMKGESLMTILGTLKKVERERYQKILSKYKVSF